MLEVAHVANTRPRGVVAASRGLAVMTVLLLAVACSDDDGEESAGVPVLEVGAASGPTCLLVDEALPPEVEELPVVDCELEHSHEVFATIEYDEQDVYPGVDELERFAELACLQQFETFVGISVFDSELSYSWLVPSLAGWNDEDDRDVLCVLADADGARLTGTMRESDR